MSEIIGFENIATHIKNDLDSDKDVLLYAFNATGKTRLYSHEAERRNCRKQRTDSTDCGIQSRYPDFKRR